MFRSLFVPCPSAPGSAIRLEHSISDKYVVSRNTSIHQNPLWQAYTKPPLRSFLSFKPILGVLRIEVFRETPYLSRDERSSLNEIEEKVAKSSNIGYRPIEKPWVPTTEAIDAGKNPGSLQHRL